MVYATLTEYDVDLDTHIRMGNAVGDAPVEGLILHAGGPSERGVHSLDVWESKEDADRFFTERMMPALQQFALGAEDGVHRLDGDAGSLGDRLNAGGGVAAGHEELEGRVEERPPGVAGLGLTLGG